MTVSAQLPKVKDPIEIREYQGRKFWVRPGSSDDFYAKEAFNTSKYLDPMAITTGDRVLDIGSNIGTFLVACAERHAYAFGYEPEPENFEMAITNVFLNEGTSRYVTIHPEAIIWDDRPNVNLFLAPGRNFGNHSLNKQRGRKKILVPARNVNQVISQHKINKVKINIEGPEDLIVRAINDWDSITAITMKFHVDNFPDGPSRARSMKKFLEGHLSRVIQRHHEDRSPSIYLEARNDR